MSLDQWTPATVAAAQANRARRYGARNSQRNWTSSPMDAEILGRIYRMQLQNSVAPIGDPARMEPGPEGLSYFTDVIDRGNYGDYGHPVRRDWEPYVAARANWSPIDHITRFGNVVQTFRQAVARIVRRAKWRRIIKALKLRERAGVIPTFGDTWGSNMYSTPRMWPNLRGPETATANERARYNARFGGFP